MNNRFSNILYYIILLNIVNITIISIKSGFNLYTYYRKIAL